MEEYSNEELAENEQYRLQAIEELELSLIELRARPKCSRNDKLIDDTEKILFILQK